MNAIKAMFMVVVLLLGGVGLCLKVEQHQYSLDRQLIAALVKSDTDQAYDLVNEGADPNTPYTPMPSPSAEQLWHQLFHPSAQPTNHKVTAWLLVCGTSQNDTGELLWDQTYRKNQRSAFLIQAMVAHGANINAQDWYDRTPLMLNLSDYETVRLLLQHGAKVNAQDNGGKTALHYAVEDHYIDKRIYTVLLAYEADPRIADNTGRSPLFMAQIWKRPDVVAILNQVGAKK